MQKKRDSPKKWWISPQKTAPKTTQRASGNSTHVALLPGDQPRPGLRWGNWQRPRTVGRLVGPLQGFISGWWLMMVNDG